MFVGFKLMTPNIILTLSETYYAAILRNLSLPTAMKLQFWLLPELHLQLLMLLLQLKFLGRLLQFYVSESLILNV